MPLRLPPPFSMAVERILAPAKSTSTRESMAASVGVSAVIAGASSVRYFSKPPTINSEDDCWPEWSFAARACSIVPGLCSGKDLDEIATRPVPVRLNEVNSQNTKYVQAMYYRVDHDGARHGAASA